MYIKIATLEFPRYEGDIRLEYPEIPIELTGDAFPYPETYAPVSFTNPPTVTANQRVSMGVPVLSDQGQWLLTWVVTDLTEEEIKKNAEQEKLMAEFREARANRPIEDL